MVWDGNNTAGTDFSALVACTSTASITSTSNVTVAGLSQGITSTSTNDVWEVHLDPEIAVAGTNPVCIVELLVDGSAYGAQIIVSATTGAAPRWPAHKTYRVTGLAAGAHTLTVRSRMNAASMNATVNVTNSTMYVHRIA